MRAICLSRCFFLIVCVLLIHGGQGTGQDTHNPLEHIHLFNAVDERHSLKARVVANITEVEGRSAWVEVSWSGFKSPSFDDWLGVLAPADAHVQHSTPVKYVRAARERSHLEHGSGTVTCDFHARLTQRICPLHEGRPATQGHSIQRLTCT